MNSYKKLLVWQKALELVDDIYKVSRSFPREENFGLISHIRKTAISIPSNIAEGHGRSGKNDFVRFLDISLGSTNELETQLIIACRQNYITETKLNEVVNFLAEIQKMLKGLIYSLVKNNKASIRSN